jgi:predicted ester cyclase
MEEMIIRMQRTTVDEHIRQETAKNWPRLYDTIIQDQSAFYDIVPFNVRYSGFSGVKDFYQAVNASFPDFDIAVWGEYDVPGCSIREVTISGTHQGDWCGIPGTGKHVRFHLAAFFLFGAGEHAGKVLSERIYFDNATIMRQLRGEMDEASLVDFATLPAKGARSAV